MFYVVNSHVNNLYVLSNKAVGRGKKIKINSRPLFNIIFKLKNDNFKTRDFSLL